MIGSRSEFKSSYGIAQPTKFLVAHPSTFARPRLMGAKYIPTIKDQKASQSFLKKQNPNHPAFKKSSGAGSKKGKKS